MCAQCHRDGKCLKGIKMDKCEHPVNCYEKCDNREKECKKQLN